MILPNKHLKLSNSFINTGAILLNSIEEDSSVTLLWDKAKNMPEIRNFESFTLSLDLLFLLGLIEIKEGLIARSLI